MRVNATIKTSPCPFCGGNVQITNGISVLPFLFFKCTKCGAVISFDNEECNYNPKKAKEYFERRTK